MSCDGELWSCHALVTGCKLTAPRQEMQESRQGPFASWAALGVACPRVSFRQKGRNTWVSPVLLIRSRICSQTENGCRACARRHLDAKPRDRVSSWASIEARLSLRHHHFLIRQALKRGLSKSYTLTRMSMTILPLRCAEQVLQRERLLLSPWGLALPAGPGVSLFWALIRERGAWPALTLE